MVETTIQYINKQGKVYSEDTISYSDWIAARDESQDTSPYGLAQHILMGCDAAQVVIYENGREVASAAY